MKKIIFALVVLLLPSLTFAQVIFPNRGGTGTSTIPAPGQVLVGQPNGTYAPQSTTTLNITASGIPLNPLVANSVTATSPTATSTFPRLSVTTAFNFLGTIITDVSSWFAGLFNANLATKTTNDLAEGGTNRYYTDARSRSALSETVPGLDYATTTGVTSLTTGFVIPTTTRALNWDTAFSWGNHAIVGYLTSIATSTVRGMFSNSATGLTYTPGTGVTSLTAGYNIPLTASTSEWTDFYQTPATRIAAGANCAWTGNSFNCSGGGGGSGSNWSILPGGLRTSTSTDFAQASFFVASSATATSTFAGRVGIGTTTPAQEFDVAGDGLFTSSLGIRRSDNGQTVGLFQISPNGMDISANNSNGRIIFNSNGSESMRVSGTNVGIGTNIPDVRLHVQDVSTAVSELPNTFAIFGNVSADADNTRVSFLTGTTGTAFLDFGRLNAIDAGGIRYNNNTNALSFFASSSERLTILNNGNVGIGTSTPTSPLQVSSATFPQLALTHPTANTMTLGVTVNGFGVISGTNRNGIGETLPGGRLSVLGGVGIGSATYSQAIPPSNGMVVEGNVGIGTTTPQTALTVVGTTTLATTTTGVLTIRGELASQSLTVRPLTNLNGIEFNNQTNNGNYIFLVNGNERFRFNSSGHLALGTDGSYGPNSALSVNGSAIIGNAYRTLSAPANGLAVQGSVGIGTVAPSSTLHVVGTTTLATTSATSLSIGSLTGFLRATAGAVATSLVNLATDVTGFLGIGNGGTGTSTAPTTDAILVGNAGSAYDYRRIVSGTNVTVSTSTPGQIQISATGGGGGSSHATSSWTVCALSTCDFVTDGTADDVQINQALSIASSTGGVVQLFAQNYNLSAPIRLSGLATEGDGNPEIQLIGMGREATKIYAATNQNAIEIRNRAKYDIRKVTIFINGTGTGIRGFAGTERGNWQSNIEDIYIVGDFATMASTSWGIDLQSPFRMRLANIEMNGVANGANLSSHTDSFNPGNISVDRMFIDLWKNSANASATAFRLAVASSSSTGVNNLVSVNRLDVAGGSMLTNSIGVHILGSISSFGDSRHHTFTNMNIEDVKIAYKLQRARDNTFLDLNYTRVLNGGKVIELDSNSHNNKFENVYAVAQGSGQTFDLITDANGSANLPNFLTRVDGFQPSSVTINATLAGNTIIEHVDLSGGSPTIDSDITTRNNTRTFQDVLVTDDAYGVGWNGLFEVPTKNAVYDIVSTLGGGGGGGGGWSTTTGIVGDGGIGTINYVTTDVLFGGSSSTTASFQFDKDGSKFIIATTSANATATIESNNNAQAVRIGDDNGSGIEHFFGTIGSVIYRMYGAVTRFVWESSTGNDLFIVDSATSTPQHGSNLPGFLQATLARVFIGDDAGDGYNKMGTSTSPGALTVNGMIMQEGWNQIDCSSIVGAIQISADGLTGCDGFTFMEDGAGTLTSTAVGGIIYGRLSTAAINDGAGVFLNAPTGGGLIIATSTPVLEVTARLHTVQNQGTTTETFIGFTNIASAGTTYETRPTIGCFFTASSTQANWRAICQTGTGAITNVDTGIASSTVATGDGVPYHFLIQTGTSSARFFIQQIESGALTQVANITTNVPNTVALNAGVHYGRISNATAVGVDVYDMNIGWRKALAR
jgi:hypothetical protein